MPARATQSASAETPLGPKLPLRLGRYSLCEELGAGGMATVYLGRMELAAGLERLVALKTIHPHLAREKPFVDMFLDEARIASHVSHPNVCAVYDFGEVEGVYYLAMEHLLGEPLFDVINRLVERFDDVREVLPYVAARLVADACEGLHAAHSARGPDGQQLGIVHRDVSPQNLFITYEGSVKVVDFGCAKAAQRVAHTSTGVMKGKVGYAAPEQLRADDVDQRADVWALGVCLWETLTLSPLFTKETAMKTAMSVLEDAVPLASDDRGWVPEAVARIAEKALRRAPEERYATARDMGRDLRKFIADSGFTLEAAELAEWMDFLFEERRLERAAQVARVREMDTAGIAVVHVLAGDASGDVSGEMATTEAVSVDDVELLPDARSGMDVLPLSAARGSVPELDEEPALERASTPDPKRFTPAEEEPVRRGSRWVMVLVALLGLVAAGYFLNVYYEPAPWLLDLVGGPVERGSDGESPLPVSAPPELSGDPSADPSADPAADSSADPSADPGVQRAGTDGETDGATVPGTPATAAPAPAASAGGGVSAPATPGSASGEPSAAPATAEPAPPRPRRRRESGGGVTTVVSGGSYYP